MRAGLGLVVIALVGSALVVGGFTIGLMWLMDEIERLRYWRRLDHHLGIRRRRRRRRY